MGVRAGQRPDGGQQHLTATVLQSGHNGKRYPAASPLRRSRRSREPWTADHRRLTIIRVALDVQPRQQLHAGSAMTAPASSMTLILIGDLDGGVVQNSPILSVSVTSFRGSGSRGQIAGTFHDLIVGLGGGLVLLDGDDTVGGDLFHSPAIRRPIRGHRQKWCRRGRYRCCLTFWCCGP